MVLLVTTAGPTVVPDDDVWPLTGLVGCLPITQTTPAMLTPERNLLFPEQTWVDPPSGGEPPDYRLPAAPLTSHPATVSQTVDELNTLREHVDVPGLSRDGPFDIHRDRHHSGFIATFVSG